MVARVTYHSGRGSRGTKLQAQVWGPPETQQPSSLSSHTHSVLRCPLVQLPSGLHRGPGPALHSPPRSRPGRWGAESSPQPCCHHLRGQTQDSGLLPGPLFSWAAGLSSSLQSMQLREPQREGPRADASLSGTQPEHSCFRVSIPRPSNDRPGGGGAGQPAHLADEGELLRAVGRCVSWQLITSLVGAQKASGHACGVVRTCRESLFPTCTAGQGLAELHPLHACSP